MRNVLVLAALSSLMISCASIKSMFGSSEETPQTQEQPKPPDPLDLPDEDSAERVAPAPSAEGQPAQAAAGNGAELSNHSDPAVAEAASELAAQTQSPANNISGVNENLPPKVINEEMRQSYGHVEAPPIYNTNSYADAPAKKSKKAAIEKKSKGKKEVAKKPKVDCKKVAKAGKKAKKTDVAYCKAEKKAQAAAKKPKVDCKKVAKAGKKAKKADVAFCKAEKKKKGSKSRVASK
ncbi:hypothetical protein B9G69_009535 [Bdellovibrio sp. SKB1291214]|uniref:hypothetical protein n=1 Tax=Bdellovibrio sp. SKB1291214 TaxID=1732569 RepID=UPI000B51DE26|nr:hypothetical protein [Bdellovibrio sp. SKB1291214]UYL07286.1 hypothetical protein B9G69_009535 [Bdellovibrio sp. SKB1291214]